MGAPLTHLVKGQGLTLGLGLAALAAIAAPDLGIQGGPLRPEATTKLAIALTFLLQGFALPTRRILASAVKLRLHSFSLAANFVLAPLLMLCLLFAIGDLLPQSMRSGFLFLAALPTTISSAVVMTAYCGGDSSAALFSTTSSNVLGIFATPLLCAFLLASSSGPPPSLLPLISKLSLLVLLPLVVGQLIRPLIRAWAMQSTSLFKRLSNGFVLFIVYASFCQSLSDGVWQSLDAKSLIATLLFSLLFLLLFSFIVWVASPLASREISERIAVFFCGSQKTLAAGVPMASLLFASQADSSALTTALIILPLMCYHSLQLLLAGLLSPVLQRRAKA